MSTLPPCSPPPRPPPTSSAASDFQAPKAVRKEGRKERGTRRRRKPKKKRSSHLCRPALVALVLLVQHPVGQEEARVVGYPRVHTHPEHELRGAEAEVIVRRRRPSHLFSFSFNVTRQKGGCTHEKTPGVHARSSFHWLVADRGKQHPHHLLVCADVLPFHVSRKSRFFPTQHARQGIFPMSETNRAPQPLLSSPPPPLLLPLLPVQHLQYF